MNESIPFIGVWAMVKKLKSLGHRDPIGDMDLYTFDVICEIESTVTQVELERIERKTR